MESIELHSGLKDTGGVSRLCDIGNTDVCGKSHIDLWHWCMYVESLTEIAKTK